MKTSRIEVTFEQHEVWRVSHSEPGELHRCPFCADASPMISAEKAAAAFKISPREIYRLVDEGSIHFIETANINVLICLASFSQRSTNQNEHTIRTAT
jgi:hypothetical protein